MEQFRRDQHGRLLDTQYQLVPQDQAYAYRNYPGVGDGEAAGAWWGEQGNRPFAGGGGYPYWRDPSPGIPQDSPLRGLFGEPRWDERRARPRRVDPDYFWGNRLFN